MNKDIPVPALAVSYIGAIASMVAEAKSMIGALAALASLIASLYAIAISRKRLKRMGRRRSTWRSRLKKFCNLHFAICILAITAFTGCSTPQGGPSPFARLAALPARILDSAATLVTTTTTNIVEQAIVPVTETVDSVLASPARTPQSSELHFVPNSVLSPQSSELRFITNITAVPKTAIAKSLDTAEAVRGFLPPPYGEAAAGGLALISALLAAAVRRRNDMLKTVIDGVERAGLPAVKEEISLASMRDGTAPEIHALVKKITRR